MKKETLTQVFSCEFCEVFKNTFFHKKKVASVYEMQHRSEMGYSRNMIWTTGGDLRKKVFLKISGLQLY